MTTETRTRLPEFLRSLFWDVAFHTLSPERHQSFVCLRLIEHGDLDALRWMVGYKVRAAWGVADHRHDSGRHAHRLGRAHQSQPFRLPIPARRALVVWEPYGTRLASREDLVCMKLTAIQQCGLRRDFIDCCKISRWSALSRSTPKSMARRQVGRCFMR